jgi:hypothetical protein
MNPYLGTGGQNSKGAQDGREPTHSPAWQVRRLGRQGKIVSLQLSSIKFFIILREKFENISTLFIEVLVIKRSKKLLGGYRTPYTKMISECKNMKLR